MRLSPKFDLPLLLAAAFLFQSYLFGPLLFHGDSIYVFQMFYIYYNQFFHHGEFVRWLPYGALGIESGLFQLNYLAPAQYLAGLIGIALRVREVLVLFKFSVFLEQVYFLFGAFLLARRLFRRRETVFFFCLGLAAGCFWFINLPWNFRLAAYLPMVMFLLLKAFDDQEPLFFWASGAAFILGHVGMMPYFVMLNSLVCGVLLAVLLGIHRRRLGFLFTPSRSNLLGLAGFLVIAGVVLFFSLHLLDGIVFDVSQRDPSGKVSLETFEHFGRGAGFGKFVYLFFPGQVRMHFHLYCGLLPLCFLAYACLRVRTAFFYMMAGVLAWLVLFSAGFQTPVASWTYHLYPPLHYFRGVGVIAALLRFFLLLGAAFGLDHYLETSKMTAKAGREKIWLLVSAAALFLTAGWLAASGNPARFAAPQNGVDFGRVVWPAYAWFSGILAAAACFVLTRRRTVFYGIAAVLFLAADLGGVHVLFARHWDLRTAAADPSVFKAAPQAFSPYRGLVPDENPRMKAGHELIAPTKNILAAEHFGFLGFDPCLPFNFLPMNWTRGIDELMQVRFPFFREADSGELMPPAEYLTYTRVVGCADTKLRLTNRVSAAGSHEEALALVKELPDFGIAHVVEAGPGEVLSEPALSQEAGKAYRMPDGSYGIEQALGRVHVTDFSYNRLRADVEVRDPGVWLYYADANHRGWKAFLDGRQVPVAAADVGFKAVRLPSGEHTVEFRFWNGWQSAASAAVALLALGYSVILIFFMVQTVRRGFLNDPA